MRELLWLGGLAFLVSLILTPIVRDIFRSYNVVDRPANRKVHVYPIPRVGGIPIAIAYTVALLVYSDKVPLLELAWKLVPGTAVIFLTGLIDDFKNLRPATKLGGQIVAALLVFAAGIRIEAVAGNQLPLWLSLPVTVFWLLLCTNALNLIDGLDGLCAGMGMLATLTLCGAALLQDNLPLAFATFPLTGALLGFLVYNFNPATVFLGDSGALLIGFLLGCYGMSWTQKTATLLSMIVPLLALSIPLLDVSLSVFRRMLRNRPIFSADRGHIHHRLLDRGLSPRRAVLVLYLVASLAAALALLLSLPRLGKWHGLIVLAFCLAVFWGVRKLRYAEFDMVSRLLFGGEFQRAVNTKLKAETVAAALEKTQSEEQWWAAVSQFAREAGLLRAVWMSSRGLREWQSQNAGSAAWSLTVAVGDNETLQLDGPDPLSEPLDLIAILSALRQSHAAKASGWSELTKAGESHG